MLWSAILAPALWTQPRQNPGAVQETVPPTAHTIANPDTTAGLHDLIQRLMTAVQNDDHAQFSALVQNLILPDCNAWFPQVFGNVIGPRMTQFYEESLPNFDAGLHDQIAGFIGAERTTVNVTRFQAPDLPDINSYAVGLVRAMQNPVPVYQVEMNKAGEGARGFTGVFVFVHEDFRYVGWRAMGAVPNLLPKRIRVGGNVQASKMIHQVLPSYPIGAKAKHVEGTVVLHVVINKDGSILEAQALLGPEELRKAAVDAVQQWRYQPTLLNGEPVQVDTTISVLFSLGRH